jgi:hypothetical protein
MSPIPNQTRSNNHIFEELYFHIVSYLTEKSMARYGSIPLHHFKGNILNYGIHNKPQSSQG